MNIEARFNELARKHALGESTPDDDAKLDRYQQLRRNQNPRGAQERRNDEKLHHEVKGATKRLLAILHRARQVLPSNTFTCK